MTRFKGLNQIIITVYCSINVVSHVRNRDLFSLTFLEPLTAKLRGKYSTLFSVIHFRLNAEGLDLSCQAQLWCWLH